VLDGVAGAIERGRVPLVVGSTHPDHKRSGIAPGRVAHLARVADHVIVEADGARRLPFKIPRNHEPVIPTGTTHVVILVGLRALGERASDETCMDIALLSERWLLRPGDRLDAPTMRRLLLGPHGYLPLLPAGSRASVLVAGDDSARGLALADDLWHPRLRAAVAASLSTGEVARADNSRLRVGAIVLAAGRAQRYGALKQTVTLDGTPLVCRAVDAALGAGLEPVVLVVGHESERVVACLGERASRVLVVRNPHPPAGMSASLAMGLDALGSGTGAAMILLADMPQVDADLARRVLAAFRTTAASVAAPDVGGRTGHPVVLRADLFDEVRALRGDQGARGVIRAHPDRTIEVPLDDPSSQLDVDRPEDLVASTDE